MKPNIFYYLLQIHITILPPCPQKISIAIMPLLRDAVMYFDFENAGRLQLPCWWSIAAIVTIEDIAHKGDFEREAGKGKKGVGLKRQSRWMCIRKFQWGVCTGRETCHMCALNWRFGFGPSLAWENIQTRPEPDQTPNEVQGSGP